MERVYVNTQNQNTLLLPIPGELFYTYSVKNVDMTMVRFYSQPTLKQRGLISVQMQLSISVSPDEQDRLFTALHQSICHTLDRFSNPERSNGHGTTESSISRPSEHDMESEGG